MVPRGRDRCMTRANMTPWWRPANRSPRACWRSPCRRSASGALLAGLADPDSDQRRPCLGADSGDRRQRTDQPLQGPQGGRGDRRLPGHQPQTGRITTLGRGGSDTSAVAIAAAIQADRCDIYTDVDGVYTTDPRVVPKARRLDKIAFEDMLELASQGAKVLQVRSVELGMVHNMPIFVRSSFDKPEDIDPHGTPPGTLICSEEEIMETTSSPASPFPRTKPRFPCARSRTSRASPPRSSGRWRTPISTST